MAATVCIVGETPETTATAFFSLDGMGGGGACSTRLAQGWPPKSPLDGLPTQYIGAVGNPIDPATLASGVESTRFRSTTKTPPYSTTWDALTAEIAPACVVLSWRPPMGYVELRMVSIGAPLLWMSKCKIARTLVPFCVWVNGMLSGEQPCRVWLSVER